MGQNIVELQPTGESGVGTELLTSAEVEEIKELLSHPANIGHILFDPDAEVLDSSNVDEGNAPVLANAFDLCECLAVDLGQRHHISATFEGRDLEITCRRLSSSRLVVFRSKHSAGLKG